MFVGESTSSNAEPGWISSPFLIIYESSIKTPKNNFIQSGTRGERTGLPGGFIVTGVRLVLNSQQIAAGVECGVQTNVGDR